MFYGQEDGEYIISMCSRMDSNGTTGHHEMEDAEVPALPLGDCLTGQRRTECFNHPQLH